MTTAVSGAGAVVGSARQARAGHSDHTVCQWSYIFPN